MYSQNGGTIRFRDRSDGGPIIDIEKTRYRLVTSVIRTLYAEIRNTPRRASSRTRSRIDQHGNYLLVIANRLPPISDHPWNSINRGREWNIVAGEIVSTIDKFSSTAWFSERLDRSFARIIVTRTITALCFPLNAHFVIHFVPRSLRVSRVFRSFIDRFTCWNIFECRDWRNLKSWNSDMIPTESMNTRGMIWYGGNQNFFLYFYKCAKKGYSISFEKAWPILFYVQTS